MDDTYLDQSFWWYDYSGDWLTLLEASEILRNELRTKVEITPKHILKLGYINYYGLMEFLPLYHVIKQPRMLRLPKHVEADVSHLSVSQNLLFAGDVFQIAPKAIESIVLLGTCDSDLLGAPARGVIFSDKFVQDWTPKVDWEEKQRSWRFEADYMIVPSLQISIEEVRVDGEELRAVIQRLKEVRNGAGIPLEFSDNVSSSENPAKRMEPVISWVDAASAIGTKIRNKNIDLTVEEISKQTEGTMKQEHAAGKPGMVGRGGKVPSWQTIKRHALGGIRNK